MIMQAKSPDSLDYDASVGCPSTLLYCVWCYCSWVSSKRRCFCGVDRQCLPIFDHRCVLLHWGLPLVVRTWTRAKALRAPHSRGSPNLSRSLIGRTISWAWNQPYNWKKNCWIFRDFYRASPPSCTCLRTNLSNFEQVCRRSTRWYIIGWLMRRKCAFMIFLACCSGLCLLQGSKQFQTP